MSNRFWKMVLPETRMAILRYTKSSTDSWKGSLEVVRREPKLLGGMHDPNELRLPVLYTASLPTLNRNLLFKKYNYQPAEVIPLFPYSVKSGLSRSTKDLLECLTKEAPGTYLIISTSIVPGTYNRFGITSFYVRELVSICYAEDLSITAPYRKETVFDVYSFNAQGFESCLLDGKEGRVPKNKIPASTSEIFGHNIGENRTIDFLRVGKEPKKDITKVVSYPMGYINRLLFALMSIPVAGDTSYCYPIDGIQNSMGGAFTTICSREPNQQELSYKVFHTQPEDVVTCRKGFRSFWSEKNCRDINELLVYTNEIGYKFIEQITSADFKNPADATR